MGTEMLNYKGMNCFRRAIDATLVSVLEYCH
jgi:hypothetical protein